VLDRKLIEQAHAGAGKQATVDAIEPIKNVDRSAGAMLSGEVAKRHGHKGLADDTITVKLPARPARAFGAFLANGVTFDLIGDGNDYVGKGLSGGRMIVRPAGGRQDRSRESIIVGNTVLYGAIEGECYFRGVAGERFAVRNSGAALWSKAVGDHGCEYMTGGVSSCSARPAATSQPACRAASPMCSTRRATSPAAATWPWSSWNRCPKKTTSLKSCIHHGGDLAHKGRVDVSGDMTRHDEERLFQLISNHMHYTGSERAKDILDNWEDFRPKFRQGDAGRVPPRAGGNGTHAHGGRGGVSGMITSTTNSIEGRQIAEYKGSSLERRFWAPISFAIFSPAFAISLAAVRAPMRNRCVKRANRACEMQEKRAWAPTPCRRRPRL
jgi:glutamate synthase (NADPH/NADH) large chain